MINEKINFNKDYNNSIELKVKVIIWHILIANIFLDSYFEKYYINFIKNGYFDLQSFVKSTWYIDLMLYWDNYTDRYSWFDSLQDSLGELLTGNSILSTLRESIIWDIILVIGKTDFEENFILVPYDLKIIDDNDSIEKVKHWIYNFVQNQTFELKNIVFWWEMQGIKNTFLEKIQQILS